MGKGQNREAPAFAAGSVLVKRSYLDVVSTCFGVNDNSSILKSSLLSLTVEIGPWHVVLNTKPRNKKKVTKGKSI